MAQITLISSTTGNLNKTFLKDGSKIANANFSYGTYNVLNLNSPSELSNNMKLLRPNDAYVLGVPKDGTLQGLIGAKKLKDNTNQPMISRTKDDFTFPNEHYLCFDYDADKDGFKVESQEHYIQTLYDIDPSLKGCGIVVVESSSNGIMINNVSRSNSKGYHAWVRCSNSSDENVSTYAKYLENNCWEKGYGHIKISKSGSQLPRAPIDFAIFSPERIMYEAYPTLGEDVTKEVSEPYIVNGQARDLSKNLEHSGEGFKLIEQAKLKSKDKADEIKSQYKESKANDLSKKLQIPVITAKEIIEKRVEDSEILSDDYVIAKNGQIKVEDIFLNPNLYNELEILDPLEPEENKFNSKIYINDGANIIISSFKHGGKIYKCIPNKKVIEDICHQTTNQGYDLNKTAVNKIKSLCDIANIDNHDRKELASILKGNKIISRIDALTSYTNTLNFPDVRKNSYGLTLLNTMDNLRVLLEHHNINVEYNVISKKAKIDIPLLDIDTTNEINTKIAWIKSEAIKVGLDSKCVDEYLPSLIDLSSNNPLLEMITSKPWDGSDRFQQLADTLITDDDKEYVLTVITKWIIQCVAAWDHAQDSPIENISPRFESVLTLVGPQGIGKTQWFESFLANEYRKYMKSGHHLDALNKDSVKIAVSAGITELGELDSSFKKDISALKAFLSVAVDIFRLPYAKAESAFKRQTSFCASVNDDQFLVDDTGNRRFHPISVKKILFDLLYKIDMQQLFAQAYDMYISGSKWWIDANVDVSVHKYLLSKHKKHAVENVEDDIILKVISDTKEISHKNDLITTASLSWKTATEIATHFKLPTNKRKLISNIKKALSKADIEYKKSSQSFNVYLKPF